MKSILLFCPFFLLLLWSCGVAAPIPEDGLVAYYPFSGDVKDHSINKNNGYSVGATFATDRKNKEKGACVFGPYAWVVVPQADILNQTDDKSISLWVYLPENKNMVMYPTLISKADNCYQTYCIQLNGSPGYGDDQYKIDFFFGNGTTNYSCNSIVKYPSLTGRWSHIVGTYSKAEGISRIYINGVLENTFKIGGVSSNRSDGDLYLGKAGNLSGQTYFTGKLDDVRIYKRVLTQKEITALFKE